MLTQVDFIILPQTSRKETLRKKLYLQEGILKELVIRLLSGSPDDTSLSIFHKEQCLYQPTDKTPLDEKGMVSLSDLDVDLPEIFNPIIVEGYNENQKEVSRFRIEFTLVSNFDYHHHTRVRKDKTDNA